MTAGLEKQVKPARVLAGAEGWLFLDHDANASVAQYTGDLTLSQDVRRTWRRHFERIETLKAELGFDFVQLFAPSKESVYDDWYFHRPRRAAVRPIDEVIAEAPPGLKLLFPREELVWRRGHHVTYDKGDTHWNDYGAAIAARLALRLVGRDIPDPASFDYEIVQDYQDLDSKIPGLEPGDIVRLVSAVSAASTMFDSMLTNRGRVIVLENPEAPEGRLVLFGDSFASKIRPFFSYAFRRVVFVHSNSVDAEFLRIEQPDVVIAEMAERFVTLPPRDAEKFHIIDLLMTKLEGESAEERRRLSRHYATYIGGREEHLAELFLQALATIDDAIEFSSRHGERLAQRRDRRKKDESDKITMAEARARMRTGDYHAALESLNGLFDGEHRSKALSLKLLCLSRIEPEQARDSLVALIGEEVDQGAVYSTLAAVYLRNGDMTDALAAAKKSVEIDPASLAFRKRLLFALRTTRQYVSARQVVLAGLDLHPDEPDLTAVLEQLDLKLA